MPEFDIIELEDYNFNHAVHHYDGYTRELIEYVLENGTMDVHVEYYGKVYWDEQE